MTTEDIVEVIIRIPEWQYREVVKKQEKINELAIKYSDELKCSASEYGCWNAEIGVLEDSYYLKWLRYRN